MFSDEGMAFLNFAKSEIFENPIHYLNDLCLQSFKVEVDGVDRAYK